VAAKDLREILFWYTTASGPELAQRMKARIFAAIERAVAFPHSGTPTRKEGDRALVVAPYILRYRIHPDHIMILRVRHGARKPV
jgi:plasmid stabilization system protein ParE